MLTEMRNGRRTDPDFEVLAADNELVQAVLVVVRQDKGGHIVPCHRPKWIVPWVSL